MARVLILNDRVDDATDPWLLVTSREAARPHLVDPDVRAVCVDRTKLAETASDVRWLRRRRNRLPVVAIVDGDQVVRAAELLSQGVEELIIRQGDAREALRERLDAIERRMGGPVVGPRGVEGIVARSPAMRGCLELLAKAQRTQATALLLGETGTGKEVMARLIHEGGERCDAVFVGINCASLPETLLESELFGYERGAFTGATQARRGHFETAHGGTLFLDEIGETSPAFQVKLLRVLQEGMVRRVGADHELPIDVRIIAATNRALDHEVEVGRFRRDLYYRLNVFPIRLPPLRARQQDIVPLVERFLARHPGAPQRVAPDAAPLLEMHTWPGNVRELENEVARIAASANGETAVTARMLSPAIRRQADALPVAAVGETLREARARFESWLISRALEENGGRKSATARSLGVTREGLYKKLVRYQLQ
jgi:transcriptional regulator with PAS, ATPase and Fis domain